MKTKIILVMLVLLAISLNSAFAGSSLRIGTAGGQELLVPIGSRGTAMGGSLVSLCNGVEAILYNPAGLGSLEGTEAMFSHLPYIADINVNFVGVGTYIEGFGTLAASAKIVSIGDMEETTNEFPDGTGRIYSPTLSVMGLTYARQITANVSFGATASFISENIFEAQANGMAFDFGVTYDPRWKGVKIGMVIKNYGPSMKFSGKGFERDLDGRKASPNSATFDLPAFFSMGASYNFLKNGFNSATICAAWKSNAFSEDFWQGGMEYSYNDKFFLRGGYNYSKQNDYIYGAALGAGITIPMGNSKLTFEYAWNQTDTFEDNQFFTIKVNF
jgi:hypothetical protein